MSHNVKRTTVRTKSYLDQNLRVSLQTLSAEESLVRLENKLDKSTNNKLRGIRQILLELRVCGCIDFEFGFEVFSSFFNTLPQRQYFRDSLIEETYGIPVLIYREKFGQQWIILKDGSVPMESIFLHLVQKEEPRQEEYGEDVAAELVHRAIDSMVNEYDRQVTKALLSIHAGKTLFGMTSSRAANLLNSLEKRLDAWEACKSEAEADVNQRLADRITSLQARVDATTEKIEAVTGRWPPERVGDLDNERISLQESLEHVQRLKVFYLLLSPL